ncbi:hypothetical protein E2C01_092572 [Portunus trituberculatus]|uniref:Uncharacterized protein n=1 Tax=Portunus trituberculatus TaxID=210409 RepID=A0A5B7JVT2_PORTR|nr:hypothetical protein [Portunus trituberculatus]
MYVSLGDWQQQIIFLFSLSSFSSSSAVLTLTCRASASSLLLLLLTSFVFLLTRNLSSPLASLPSTFHLLSLWRLSSSPSSS